MGNPERFQSPTGFWLAHTSGTDTRGQRSVAGRDLFLHCPPVASVQTFSGGKQPNEPVGDRVTWSLSGSSRTWNHSNSDAKHLNVFCPLSLEKHPSASTAPSVFSFFSRLYPMRSQIDWRLAAEFGDFGGFKAASSQQMIFSFNYLFIHSFSSSSSPPSQNIWQQLCDPSLASRCSSSAAPKFVQEIAVVSLGSQIGLDGVLCFLESADGDLKRDREFGGGGRNKSQETVSSQSFRFSPIIWKPPPPPPLPPLASASLLSSPEGPSNLIPFFWWDFWSQETSPFFFPHQNHSEFSQPHIANFIFFHFLFSNTHKTSLVLNVFDAFLSINSTIHAIGWCRPGGVPNQRDSRLVRESDGEIRL